MQYKPPKDDSEFSWTNHSIEKMRQYGLTASRVKKLVRNPERKEAGIAPGTVAVMQTTRSKKRPTEIWAMYKEDSGKKKIIVAWRYPGISPRGEDLPVPEDMAEELPPI